MAKHTQTTYSFQVTLVAPNRASIAQTRKFLLDAIEAEKLVRNPGDTFKDLDMDSVKIHLTNKEVKYG